MLLVVRLSAQTGQLVRTGTVSVRTLQLQCFMYVLSTLDAIQ